MAENVEVLDFDQMSWWLSEVEENPYCDWCHALCAMCTCDGGTGD